LLNGLCGRRSRDGGSGSNGIPYRCARSHP
jgi:hypothetical protein